MIQGGDFVKVSLTLNFIALKVNLTKINFSSQNIAFDIPRSGGAAKFR